MKENRSSPKLGFSPLGHPQRVLADGGGVDRGLDRQDVGEHRGRVAGPIPTVGPELLATACVHHQGHVVGYGPPGRPHQQLVEGAVEVVVVVRAGIHHDLKSALMIG